MAYPSGRSRTLGVLTGERTAISVSGKVTLGEVR
jgi:hypothetical protein